MTRSWKMLTTALMTITALVGGLPVSATAADTATATARTHTVEIWASNTGWYMSSGLSTSLANRNYSVGFVGAVGGGEVRNWFVFDLSSVAGQVKAATIVADNPVPALPPLATYRLWEVSTPISTLLTPHYLGPDGQAIFADLGDGLPYGSTAITAPTVNPVSITLNAHGLRTIAHAEGGSVAVGGTYASTGYLFGDTGGQAVNMVRLDLTVGS